MSRYKIETVDLGPRMVTYSIKANDGRDAELAMLIIAKSSEGVRLKEWIEYAPEVTTTIDGMIRILKTGSLDCKEEE